MAKDRQIRIMNSVGSSDLKSNNQKDVACECGNLCNHEYNKVKCLLCGKHKKCLNSIIIIDDEEAIKKNKNNFGLQIRAPVKRKQLPLPIFGQEIEDSNVENEISTQALKTKNLLKQIDEEKRKKALEEDPFAFAYDEVYDDMKQKALLPRMQDREERKPRYIQGLMKQANRRQKEHEIVYERKLGKERAKDEHLYYDKDKFIGGAYKSKLIEQNKWLEEERLRELCEEKDDVTKKKDLSEFYFNIGKNVAFGAPHIEEARETENLKTMRKEETMEELSALMSGDLGSGCSTNVEPQEEAEKKFGKEERGSLVTKRKMEDVIDAAKQRLLARKKTII